MIYRAKCKLCKDILETEGNEHFCGCGEISIGGNNDPARCSARDFKNFVRVDDEGNEIEVEYKEHKKITKETLRKTIQGMIEDIDKLPPAGKQMSANQFDMLSIYYLLSALLDCEA